MKPEMKKLIIANLPYLLFVYLFGKLGQTYLSSLRRKRRRVITEDEPFDLYDIELSEEDFSAE